MIRIVVCRVKLVFPVSESAKDFSSSAAVFAQLERSSIRLLVLVALAFAVLDGLQRRQKGSASEGIVVLANAHLKRLWIVRLPSQTPFILGHSS